LRSLTEKLREHYDSHRFLRELRRLKWPLDEQEHLQAVEAVHRYAQIFQFSLTIEGWYGLCASRGWRRC
jgi:hypothetical protein